MTSTWATLSISPAGTVFAFGLVTGLEATTGGPEGHPCCHAWHLLHGKVIARVADKEGFVFSVKGGEGIIARGWGSRTSSVEHGEATQMRGTLENLRVQNSQPT